MREQRNTGVAIIGARDGSLWTNLLVQNVTNWRYSGEVWPVSRTRSEVAGYRAYQSLDKLPDVPDAVVIAVGTEEALETARQAIAMGIPHVVVLADGFAERGTVDGRRYQATLVEMVKDSSRVYGPNGVGFADFRSGLCPVAAPIPAALPVGPVGLISQSGSLLSTISGGLLEDGVGLDWCVSLGNGAAFDVSDALEYLIGRQSTTVICGYVESFGRASREKMENLFGQARAAGKRIVLMKAGGSDRSARIALSHTASIAGADRVIGEIMAQYGVIRAHDPEELVRTVGLLAYLDARPIPPGRGGGVAVIESSGGTGAIVADKLQNAGVPLADFTPETLTILRNTAPTGAFVENPIDLTASPKTPEAIERAYRAVYEDHNVSMVLVPWALTFPPGGEARELHTSTIERYAELARGSGTPAILSSANLHAWTDWMLDFRANHPEMMIVRGLSSTVEALRHILPMVPTSAAAGHGSRAEQLIDEAAGREILAALDVPLVAGVLSKPPFDRVREDARLLRAPYVVKIIAAGVAHRARIGGVIAGCRNLDDVEAARDTILRNVGRAGVLPDQIRGLLIEEMVFGPELIVGLNRDPWYGPFAVVGRGGVNVEDQGGSRVISPPFELKAIIRTLEGLGLVGAAGHDSAVLEKTAALVVKIGTEFVSGRLQGYSTAELNPVILSSLGPEIADVLLVKAG